jgi:hypothetical protein
MMQHVVQCSGAVVGKVWLLLKELGAQIWVFLHGLQLLLADRARLRERGRRKKG